MGRLTHVTYCCQDRLETVALSKNRFCHKQQINLFASNKNSVIMKMRETKTEVCSGQLVITSSTSRYSKVFSSKWIRYAWVIIYLYFLFLFKIPTRIRRKGRCALFPLRLPRSQLCEIRPCAQWTQLGIREKGPRQKS